ISILRLSRGVFEVIATGGDTALGGDDFDHAIVDWLAREHQVDASARNVRSLLVAARAAREALSDAPVATLRASLPDGGTLEAELTRERFEALVEPLIQRTLTTVRRTLRDAGLRVDEVKGVV